MKWFLKVFRLYGNTKGRARIKEFWMFFLFDFLFSFFVVFFEYKLRLVSDDSEYSPISTLYNLVLFTPRLAVAVRRLHDVGKRGYILLLFIVPFGIIWLINIWFLDSYTVFNKYGLNPKAISNIP